jgi:hypothetical protein
MVLLSGVSFGMSYRHEPYGLYVWKRFKRLVVPVWIFLTAYFLLATLVLAEHFSRRAVAESYLLLDGIGYVWIIRVLIVIALLAPLIQRANRRIKRNGIYLLCIAAAYSIYEMVHWLTHTSIEHALTQQIAEAVFDLFPYTALFALGIRLPILERSWVRAITLGALALFVAYGTVLYLRAGHLVPTQEFKYPPSLYYLAYALAVSCALWMYAERIWQRVPGRRLRAFMLFIGQNSIWCYLWHILLVDIVHAQYMFKFVIVFGVAAGITLLQVKSIQNFVLPNIKIPAIRNNIRVFLTG